MEMSPNKNGFNIVVLDYKTGKMENSVSFDTNGIGGQYEKMQTFLDGLADWKIVCVAIKNDGEAYLPKTTAQRFVSKRSW